MMRIRVTAEGFSWESPTGEKHTAPMLGGPNCCRGKLEVFRGGVLFDTATIHHIGTHGSYDGFDGLEKFGGHYHEILRYEQFQLGDELMFSDLPSELSQVQYWEQLALQKP